MDFSNINYFAVLAAAAVDFILGGLWYSPLLFGKAWMRANNFTDADVQTFSKARMFGWSIVFSLVMALNLAMFLAAPDTNASWGMTAGALAGLGWVAMAIAIIGLFENKSWSYIAINGGYMTVAFTIMGRSSAPGAKINVSADYADFTDSKEAVRWLRRSFNLCSATFPESCNLCNLRNLWINQLRSQSNEMHP